MAASTSAPISPSVASFSGTAAATNGQSRTASVRRSAVNSSVSPSSAASAGSGVRFTPTTSQPNGFSNRTSALPMPPNPITHTRDPCSERPQLVSIVPAAIERAITG